MDRKEFRSLIDPEEARNIFLSYAPAGPLGVEELPIKETLGRVLAEEILSPIDVPPFDRAAMDGFAIRANNVVGSQENSSRTLKVVGNVKAGYTYDKLVNDGESVEISTGAPLPAGADAVVMVEYTNRKGDFVEIFKSATPGQHIMSAGADIQKGERILSSKTLLTSRELAVLSAMGFEKAPVFVKPKIGIFSSGDEVISPGDELKPGKLYDINSMTLYAGLMENGGNPEFLGIIPDNLEDLESRLRNKMGLYDLLIVSGGTSAGMGDLLYSVVDKLGNPGLLVHGVKVKPGKPTILAVCDNTPIIGLPGYPASALSIFQLFVIPYVRQLAQIGPLSEKQRIKATVKQRLRSVMGRHEFKPMNLIKTNSGWLAFPVPGGSGAITSIAMADGFVEIAESDSFILPDQEVTITLFSENIKPFDLQITGSHCIGLSNLQKLMASRYPNFRTRTIGVGSSGGVSAIRRGECHVAGVHLLGKNGVYNKWLLEELDAILIPGYFRMQGFVVPKGNPKNITSIKDLLREDIIIINRNSGSGTRVLFDYLLEENSIDQSQIKGYSNTSKSHTSVANAVKTGSVDVGIAIETVIDNSLDFIPLKEEEYDFLINKEYSNLDSVKAFIELLKSKESQKLINSLPGYRSK